MDSDTKENNDESKEEKQSGPKGFTQLYATAHVCTVQEALLAGTARFQVAGFSVELWLHTLEPTQTP